MHDLPANTLAMSLMHPMFDRMDQSHVPARRLADEFRRLSNLKTMPVPETEALRFYFFNHAFHVLQKNYNKFEHLPDDMAEVARTYVESGNEGSRRLFSFLLVITSYMASFLPRQEASFYNHIESRCGEDTREFLEKFCTGWSGYSGNGGAKPFIDRLTGLLDTATFSCANFSEAIIGTFMYGKWGQPKGLGQWDIIAMCAAGFIRGDVSLEGMADQAFSLCHQGGTIFEKGYFYQTNSHDIYHLLDVQHSGQLPQWIEKNFNHRFVTDDIRRIHTLMKTRFPQEMTGTIDPAKVREAKEKREAAFNGFHARMQAAFANGRGGGAARPAAPKAPPPTQRMDNIISGLIGGL